MKRIALSVSIILITVAISAWGLFFQSQPAPRIQGVLLTRPAPLDDFVVINQHRQLVTREKFNGHWSLLGYGYTDCPDICPTTLSLLRQVQQRLEREAYGDLQLVFYSVDYLADKPERLGQYLSFFGEDIQGLVADVNRPEGRQSFERSLGIAAELTPLQGDDLALAQKLGAKEYRVAHSVLLLLINPSAQLQAVFKPQLSADNRQYFSADQLYEDYIKVREFLPD